MKVFVYYNLHRACWSLKALEGAHKGLVVAHAPSVLIEACTFKVSEAGRQRVLAQKRKNVHAGIVGNVLNVGAGSRLLKGTFTDLIGEVTVPDGPTTSCYVSYNPYKGGHFTRKDTDAPVHSAVIVSLLSDRKCLALGAE